jgi:1-deoxy-D-xylulose-5-phosphate synthase
MIYGSELSEFQDVLPNQIIDVGIAEEHSVVMASTLALSGMIPVISIYSTFMQRTYDQINHDVARTNAHVVFLVDRAGIVGPDGSTHQGTFDIAFLSHLPNMVITMPKDLSEAKALLDYGINKHDGPFVIRYPRGSVVKDTKEVTKVDFGKWEIVNEIKDVNIISYGPVVLKFKTLLKELGKDFGLINARFIKPIDIETLKKLEGKQVIVYEEVILKGSLCSMILETNLKEKIKMEIDSYGIDDQYVEHGQIKELKKELGLDIRDILEKY